MADSCNSALFFSELIEQLRLFDWQQRRAVFDMTVIFEPPGDLHSFFGGVVAAKTRVALVTLRNSELLALLTYLSGLPEIQLQKVGVTEDVFSLEKHLLDLGR